MPHINRIRVNNVKYNFGTQFYDDFMMRFSGKNTIYDLANGGGKSVLMLLLMQNLIPNCTLDEKQPLEKLFRTNEGSTTIHSLVEWILSDVHIQNGFKYMLTGFCARRAKDNGEEKQKNTAEIEYFNYCIFYRKYNDNDIKNLPLSSNGERITYTGLKNYLKELDRKDYNLEVHIFERKGDYQRFISRYGLYESHWEIIRGINKTEGHVRTYFETNYRTTRKVVEDLLIEEIIQKSFQNKYHSDNEQDHMAKTLLDIKDKLLELSKKREELQNYDRQMEILNSFSERMKGIRQIYIGMEDLETELSKAYYTLLKEEECRKKERVEIADKKLSALNQKNELNRRVETAKVMKKTEELHQYKKKLSEYQSRIEEQKKELERICLELVEKECGNDYLDYRNYKEEYDKTKEMLEYAWKDKDSLTGELRNLAAAWKTYCTKRITELESATVTEEEKLRNEKEVQVQYAEQKNALSKELAILEFQLKENTIKKEKLSEQSSSARNNAGILIPATAGEELKKLSYKQSESEKKKTELEEQLLEIEKKQQDYYYQKQQIQQKEKYIQTQIEWYQQEEKKCLLQKESAESIGNVYGQKKYPELRESIRLSIQEKTVEINELKKNLELLKERLAAKKAGKLFQETESIHMVLDYIERYHGEKVVSGLEYLKKIAPEQQEQILFNVPILPYSIVVLKDFEEIISDERLSTLNSPVHPVALIKESILNQENGIRDNDNIYYIFEKEEILEKDDARERRIHQLEEKIRQEEQKVIRQSETLRVMEEDYELIGRYLSESEKYQKITNQLDELKLDLKKNEVALENLNENATEWETSQKKISEALETLKKEIQENQIQQELLEEVYKYYKDLKDIDEEIDEITLRIEKIRRDIHNLEGRMEALARQVQARSEKIVSLRAGAERLQKEWQEKYASYYIEGTASELSLPKEELKAKLDGVIEAVKKENSGLEDRQKLLESYHHSMKKALERIRYKGYEPEHFKTLWEAGELKETSGDILNRIRDSRDDLNKKMEDMVKEEKELASKCDKQDGNISNAIQVISEKYGYYEEESITAEDMDVFISENAGLLKGYDREIREAEESLSQLDKEMNRYLLVRHDIESRMEIEGIAAKEVEECFDDGINIEEKCREILKKHERFRNDVSVRREGFQQEKQMLIDTMKRIGGEALAEEIRINVLMPSNYEETNQLISMFADTVECLKLERDMVGRGIEDMEKIKENFESQCLQNCLSMKTELERLPKLSRIVMDGETIPMISLKIPYKKEEEYTGTMEAYIDEIAHNVDELGTTEERMRYIRNKLSWKKLFSVIVTDMNGIRLNLYKRERIKEQSRYLPYEEAVGSTGQSQGIYIQFLISIINYISSIHSQNADASNLRKVVFLDNPFGAAKDVYIWEPIFKLLKTNNVQLIVPARGATPAITGRFDVNYVLGQKMNGKRQQTVVTDYFSNVENEEIEYTKMSYEQTSLF